MEEETWDLKHQKRNGIFFGDGEEWRKHQWLNFDFFLVRMKESSFKVEIFKADKPSCQIEDIHL